MVENFWNFRKICQKISRKNRFFVNFFFEKFLKKFLIFLRKKNNDFLGGWFFSATRDPLGNAVLWFRAPARPPTHPPTNTPTHQHTGYTPTHQHTGQINRPRSTTQVKHTGYQHTMVPGSIHHGTWFNTPWYLVPICVYLSRARTTGTVSSPSPRLQGPPNGSFLAPKTLQNDLQKWLQKPMRILIDLLLISGSIWEPFLAPKITRISKPSHFWRKH